MNHTLKNVLFILLTTPTLLYAELAILEDSASARILARGYSGVAIADGINSIQLNPAGVIITNSPYELSGMYRKGLWETVYEFVGATVLLKNNNVVGISGLVFDAGKEDVTGIGEVAVQKDFVVSGTYRFAVDPKKIHFGVNLKYIASSLAERYNIATWGVDVGILYFVKETISFGAVVRNFGEVINYNNFEQNLPLDIRAGVALKSSKKDFVLSADTMLKNNLVYHNVGIEYILGSLLTIRGGYTTQFNTYTAGLGFRFNKISVDYAYIPIQELPPNHILSLTLYY